MARPLRQAAKSPCFFNLPLPHLDQKPLLSMSSRQLRKLQKQRELEKAQELSAQELEESSEDEAPVVAKPRASLFAALGGDDEQEQDEDEEEQEPEPARAPVSEVVQQHENTSKSKKKKKKKKKGKAAPVAEAKDEEKNVEDEIDKAIKELNISTKSVADTSSSSAQSSYRINELLAVNPYNLKAVNEMRNLFGREIMSSAEAEEETERNRRRRAPMPREVDLETFIRGPPGQKKLPEVSLRRNIFIQGREHWPRQTSGGLTMKEVRRADDGGWTEYAYVHNKDYDAAQVCFFAFVQMGDPMRMVHLLKEVRKYLGFPSPPNDMLIM